MLDGGCGKLPKWARRPSKQPLDNSLKTPDRIKDMEDPGGTKKPVGSALTIDRAAFLLLRVKKAFKKKKQQRKEKNALLVQEALNRVGNGNAACNKPAPLLRSRTLPAIVVPGVSILQMQTDSTLTIEGAIQQTASACSSRRSSGLRLTPRSSLVPALPPSRRGSANRPSLLAPPPPPDLDITSDGTVVLRVPAPHVVAARAYRMSLTTAPAVQAASPSQPSQTSLAAPALHHRLARLLAAPTPKKNEGLQQPVDDNGPRRLSWERRDTQCGGSRLPRSSSIDSMVDTVWSPAPADLQLPSVHLNLSSSGCAPSAPATLGSLGLVSPSGGRRSKGHRGLAELPVAPANSKGKGGEGGGTGPQPPPPPTKMSKKQTKQAQALLDKLAQINIHQQALFAAVEHGHLEKARTILESTDVDVNSLNSDGLSPLDVAVLGNNRPLAKMLLSFGAHEGNQLKTPDSLGNHLRSLCTEAEARLQELISSGPMMGSLSSLGGPPPRSQAGAPGAGAATGCAGQGADQEKQVHHWERRTKALRRLLLGWQQSRSPNLPCSPELDVTSPTNVTIRIRENVSQIQQNQPIITKYRVQWSSRSDFSNVCGSKEVQASLPVCTCIVSGLTRGRRYFFRAQGGNLKGWGPHNTSTPNSVLPSSWRDVEGRRARFDGRSTNALEKVASAARLARPPRPPAPPARRPHRGRQAIRHLFTAAGKFHKNLRRGVYLACIIYHEDKVLVTNEDFLPVIEIDETYPACIYTDYHWLMKVACTWDDVKSLRSDMEKNASSAIHFRTKLLAAAAQMQSALCIQDLGQLYHKPLRDSHGTLVISCINAVKSPKSVSVLNSRWLPLNKVHKKLTVLSEDNTIGDLLMGTIQEQINYHQSSSVKLPKGLYLGYLKLQSSVDLIQVVVPSKAPNVLPHYKMRDNPHVSAEEWDYLKQQQSKGNGQLENQLKNTRRMSITSLQSQTPTESQQMFLDLVTSTAKKLFKYMNIPLENALTHRIYDLEVIDLSSDVSIIIICPPAEQACSVPGQREILLQRGDLLSLPIQAFEMIHLNTYQNSIINKYSKLSCTLELETVLANHSHREAFSNSELQIAKDRLIKLQELQNNLNAVWKDSRWLMDVISFARDKDKLQGGNGSNNIGIQMKNLISRVPVTQVSSENNLVAENLIVGSGSNSNLKRTLLQLPPRDPKLAKSSPGRGSWPGPNATSPMGSPGTNLLSSEFSKSEQHLSIAPREDSISSLNLSGSQYLSATSEAMSVVGPYSRKSSADSQYTHSSVVSSYFPNNQPSLNKTFDESTLNHRLPPSRSQDTLLSQPNASAQRRKSTTLNASLSATSSPLLQVKPFYAGSMVSVHTVNTTNTSDSLHSISSDSEGQSFPISTSTPNKSKSKSRKSKKADSGIASSKSMSNVKCALDFTNEPTTATNDLFLKPTTYLKPTLNAIQSESEVQKENQFFPEKPSVHFEPEAKVKSVSNKVNETLDLPSSSEGSRYSSHNSLNSDPVTVKSMSPGILQVYAAYDTGLATGTSLKLHVTPRTSAREVVDLVVKQLNMAVVLKGKDGPIYTNDKLSNFCLVAVIGARERCLRDDFKPLQLQNPWRKGRLYVRQKHDVLAALEHSSKQAAFI